MKKQATQRKRRGLLALVSAVAVLAAACVLTLPAPALAEETGVAHTVDSDGMRHYYNSVSEAISAGYGSTVYMDADWDMGSGKVEIADSKSITIQMAGHKITGSYWYAVIHVNEHASLTITSYEDAKEYTYYGYAKKNESDIKSDDWDLRELTVTTSGLISNTRANGGGRGINLEKDAKLTLENVALAGCGDTALYMREGSVANLTNASVCHNSARLNEQGGGVCMQDSCTLSLNASHIDSNYAKKNGGGVYANSGAHIYLENGSTISGNGAGKGGGGIYIDYSFFTLKSADGTGAMAGNASYVLYGDGEKKDRNGGAIHIDGSSGNNEGLIEGIAIKGNYSNSDAGGIFLDQRWTTVRNCVIAGNLANTDGGGARVNGDNVTFENCTVTGNVCDLTGNDRMGGGIEVDYDHDVTLRGTCIVKGNLRDSDGKADDIYLDSFVSRAYIKGSLDQGSSVGVRTDHSGDLRVAKNFSCATRDGLFSDESGYYISYGTDEGGDAWQRHTTKEFSVKVNGKEIGRYRNGTSVTVSAPTSQNGADFCYWSVNGSTGLYPIADYINEKTMHNEVLSFKMPQNDVNLGAVYANNVASATITCSAPVADIALPMGATLVFSDGSAGTTKVPASVSWYEVGANGEKTPAFGNAKKNTAYVANFSVARSPELVCIFSGDIKGSDVTVKFTMLDESTTEGSETSASVSETSGSLLVWSTAPKTGNSAFDAFIKNLNLVLKNQRLLGSLEAATALTADEAAGDEAASDVIETIKVNCAYNEETEEVAITAPYVEGFNFCYWGDANLSDEQTITIPIEQLKAIDSLEAYYTPVATKLEVELDAPVAGKELDTTCDEILVTAYDGDMMGFADALGADAFEVAWSPEPEDGVAAYSTTYTAVIRICKGQGVEGLESVLAQNAEVTCNGAKVSSAGFFVDSDGYLCLAVVLPPTADEETEPDDSGKTDEDETPGGETDGKSDESGKADEPGKSDCDDESGKTDGSAKKALPSTGDTTFTAVGALLAVSAVCLVAARIMRHNQH